MAASKKKGSARKKVSKKKARSKMMRDLGMTEDDVLKDKIRTAANGVSECCNGRTALV